VVTVAGSLVISPATASLSATKTYDASTGLTSNQVTITGVNGEVLGYTGTASVSDANVATGNKYVVLSGVSLANGGSGLTAGLASNYVLPSSVYASGVNSVTINKATLTYTATLATSTYGTTPSVNSGTVTGFVNNETQSTATTGTLLFSTPATSTSTTGSYAIYGSGLAANNYQFVQAAGNSNALTIVAAAEAPAASSGSGDR
jgi:hypothetical protein